MKGNYFQRLERSPASLGPLGQNSPLVAKSAAQSLLGSNVSLHGDPRSALKAGGRGWVWTSSKSDTREKAFPIELRQDCGAYGFRYRQSHIVQIIDRQPHMNRGTFRIAVPQSIPYCLEGDPLAQRANGEGMAQAISPSGGNIQTTARKAGVEDVVHAAGIQRAERSVHAEEQFALLARSMPFFQVALQCVADFIGQGQRQMSVSLVLEDFQNSSSPVDIVKG